MTKSGDEIWQTHDVVKKYLWSVIEDSKDWDGECDLDFATQRLIWFLSENSLLNFVPGEDYNGI